MKNLNTSIYDFPTLRDPARGYIYVDKTAQLYEFKFDKTADTIDTPLCEPPHRT